MIISSSFKLIVDTYISDDMVALLSIMDSIDYIFNGIFTFEAFAKIIAFGFLGDNNSYLSDTWSQLDFFIVIASFLDMAVASINLPVIKVSQGRVDR